ncbi:cellulose biosynthesis protein BcsS [Methylobacterium durans]|uniref:cellulose biosynthesis protein BcsS n=1 Tax=Methylobacterium durans TaxID=2202825 RepID=UPI002AFE5D0F|nr:cellulose biosynthesis protein BcsS [Methylobacterium durans]MEA1834122.1 cellulose biosynthesis protein BcsS [Methylobacterium durans]
MTRRHLSAAYAAALLLAAEPARGESYPLGTVVFGSLDAAPSSFAANGVKVNLDRQGGSGVAILASGGFGRRFETLVCACGTRIFVARLARYTASASTLAGYQWAGDRGVAALYAGPEAALEALTDGGGIGLLPARFGLRLQGEIWVHPSPDTLVNGTLILGSARGDLWSRLAVGYRLWGAFLGPEASLYADRSGYSKANLGLHATDVPLWRYNMRVSAGLQFESGRSALSPYLSLTFWMNLQ